MKKQNATLKSLVSEGLCTVDYDDEYTYIPLYLGGCNNSHDATYMRAIDVLTEYGDLTIYPINIHDDYYNNVLEVIANSSIMDELHTSVDDFTWYASSRIDSDPRFVFGLW